MRRVFVVTAICAQGLFSSQIASAEDVNFAGLVTASCTVVATAGTIAPNADFNVLSSKEAGGLAGQVAVTSTGGAFNVTVANPTTISAPSGGDTNLTFLTEYSASGATTASGSTAASPTFAVNTGATAVAVDLTISKPANDFFPAGAYTAASTVTCAP